MSQSVVRNVLPLDPKPSRYDVTLTPDLAAFTFVGSVVITLNASQPTRTIVCNASDMTFEKGNVSVSSDSTISCEDVAFDTRLDRATMTFNKDIPAGEFQLTIANYQGNINDKMVGFYRSKYIHEGETKYLATSQMEAVDARRALPCWDEPTHKAVFGVTMIIPKGFVALSNMPEASTEDVEGGNKTKIVFQDTPKMSSYLLAFCVSEHLKCIETDINKTRGGNTKIRVWATNNQENDGRFALEVAAKVLPLYEDFFGSDYFLPKVDLFAVPDFAAGAMENWGLITYRETALLTNDKSSAKQREWVALVVAHELAHQWFGNLVTMDWWKELWLNESFATYIEYWAVDKLFPTWEIFTQFINDECGRAFELDALESSHPVEVDVVNAEEIDEIFDAISYCKGGSVLRMVVEFIGMEAFSAGLKKYLDHFKFGNATTKDLWKFLGDAAGKDLATILEAWTAKQGFPVLNVSQDENKITVTQRRFLAGGNVKPEQDQTVWMMPTLMQTSKTAAGPCLLNERTNVITRDTEAEWTLINARRAAFTRVKYDSQMLQALVAPVAAKAISSADRMAIINDLNAFATSGDGSAADGIKFASAAYRNETDAAVWLAVVGFEADVRGLLFGNPARDKFDAWARNLYSGIAATLTYVPSPNDDHRSSQLRGTILSRMCVAGDETAVAAALGLWDNRESASISPDLRGAVYACAVRERGEEAFDALCSMYLNSTDPMEQTRCLGGLGHGRDVALITKAINFALSDKVRPQDAFRVLVCVAGNSYGTATYIKALDDNKDALWAKLPGMLIGRCYKAVENFDDASTIPQIKEIVAKLDEKQAGAVGRSVQQGIEGIQVRAAWKSRDLAAMIAAL